MSQQMEIDSVYTNFAKLEKVDSEKGIIYGVSVITIGEAKGHGLWMDDTSINQILTLARGKPDGVKVKSKHGGEVFSTCGKLVNFRKDGNQIRADLELLKSDDNFDKIIEMATKLPGEFGLSVSTSAKKETINGRKMVRFQELDSVDMVPEPAANPDGLFSAKNNKPNSMIDKIELCKFLGLAETASDEDVKTAFAAKCKADKEEMEAKKKADEKKDEKKEMSVLEAKLTELSTKLEAKMEKLELADKSNLEAAKKVEITGLISEASKEGKVVPLTDVQLMALPIETVKEMFSKLPKGQLRLSKQTTTGTTKTEFKSESEKMEFCRTQREAGAEALTAQFAALLN